MSQPAEHESQQLAEDASLESHSTTNCAVPEDTDTQEITQDATSGNNIVPSVHPTITAESHRPEPRWNPLNLVAAGNEDEHIIQSIRIKAELGNLIDDEVQATLDF